ncbi:MAG: hypothetical protein L6Q57_08715 [Alphaproteobacteria bacterium]|nr:hypothetical protein [Alphaproteobacteria bacterium]
MLRLIIILAVLGGVVILGHVLLTRHLQAQSQIILTGLGFNASFLPPPQKGWGTLTYTNIPLDAEDISHIGTLTLMTNWRGRIRILIDQANLTGEIDEDGLSLSGLQDIASFTLPAGDLGSLSQISIRDAKIGLLTESFGGIEMSLDIDAQRQTGNNFQILGRISSAQQTLAFDLSITGTLGPGQGLLQMELANGRLDAEPWNIKATRVSGSGQITPAPDQNGYRLLADIQAGGLSAGSTRWQTISGTYERAPALEKLWLEGKALQDPRIEFTFQKDTQGETQRRNGQVTFPDQNAASAFVKQGNLKAEGSIIHLPLGKTRAVSFDIEIQ